MVRREGIFLLNRRNDRMELLLHKGVSTHSAGKYTTSLRDMTKIPHLGVGKPHQGIGGRTTPPSVLLLKLNYFRSYRTIS
ncbi:hypothetical protein DBA26_15250 [Brucella canis]|nr:hypothetical protein CRN66_03265 [Brucella canis]AVO70746.1 hypothetical protein C6Y57_02185 [Brucella canis]RXX12244.1 hypothetical protein DBA26_15250 [Brucella canis]RXX15811.1 hypothetical protein DBA27_00630 [Brucella canis]